MRQRFHDKRGRKGGANRDRHTVREPKRVIIRARVKCTEQVGSGSSRRERNMSASSALPKLLALAPFTIHLYLLLSPDLHPSSTHCQDINSFNGLDTEIYEQVRVIYSGPCELGLIFLWWFPKVYARAELL